MKGILVAMLMIIGFNLSARTVELTSSNTVLIREEITTDSVQKAQKKLSELVVKRAGKNYTIYIVLDSPGGSIDDGLMFIEFAKTFKNVETISLFAASMASAIVEHLPGKRLTTDNGVLMFHRARGGVSGQFEDGELESRLELYKTMVRSMETTNASRMNITLDAYKKKVKDEMWVYGKDNVTQGVVDEVVSVKCSEELVSGKENITFLLMGIFPVDVEFSTCPLMRAGVIQGNNSNKTLMYKKHREQLKWGI